MYIYISHKITSPLVDAYYVATIKQRAKWWNKLFKHMLTQKEKMR